MLLVVDPGEFVWVELISMQGASRLNAGKVWVKVLRRKCEGQLTLMESERVAVLKSKRQFTLMESESVKGNLCSAAGSHTNGAESEIWKFGSIINFNCDKHQEKFRWHYVRFRSLWPTVNIPFIHSLTSYLSHSLILKRAKVETKTFMFILCTVRTYWHLIEQISNFSLNASPREIAFWRHCCNTLDSGPKSLCPWGTRNVQQQQ